MSAQGCEGSHGEHRNACRWLFPVSDCRCTWREFRQVKQTQRHPKNPSNGGISRYFTEACRCSPGCAAICLRIQIQTPQLSQYVTFGGHWCCVTSWFLSEGLYVFVRQEGSSSDVEDGVCCCSFCWAFLLVLLVIADHSCNCVCMMWESFLSSQLLLYSCCRGNESRTDFSDSQRWG